MRAPAGSTILGRAALLVLVVVAALACASPASAQEQPSPPKVIVVWLDGTTLADWAAPGLPAFARMLEEGGIAVLSTRTEPEAREPRAMRAAAAATAGAGARVSAEPASARAAERAPDGPEASHAALLGDFFDTVAVLGDADGDDGTDRSAALMLAEAEGVHPAATALSAPDPAFPTGRALDVARLRALLPGALARADAVLVDPGDPARVQRALGDDPDAAEPWMRAAMERSDAALAAVLQRAAALPGGAIVAVVGGTPPLQRQLEGVRLSSLALWSTPGLPFDDAALLRSGTTRRDGVVALIDVAPTLVAARGFAMPAEGRTIVATPRASSVAQLLAFDRAVAYSARARHAQTRRALVAAMVVVALAALALLSRRPLPRALRETLAVLLVAAAALPLALYLVGLFGLDSVLGGSVLVGALALVLAVLARPLLGVRRALLIVLVASAAVPLVDLLLGSPIGVRSPLGFQIAIGGRFYGVDDGVLGVVVGSAVMAAGIWLDGARDRRRAIAVVAVALAAAVWILGAPGLGSKLGAPLTAVPVFGIFAARVGRGRLTWRSVAAVAAATVVVAALLVLVDAVRGVAEQSHVVRAVGGDTDIAALIERKLRATWIITSRTIWSRAALLFAGALLLVRWRRPLAFAMLAPAHRSALLAAGVGIVVAVFVQDGGVITSAPIALAAATATLPLLLEPVPPPAGGNGRVHVEVGSPG